ncbi:MAG: TIGR01777 family oxidoreductase [Gemmatimonadales bacterium]
MDHIFEHSSDLAVSAAEAYAWHARPGVLERLTPPWEPVQIIERTGGLGDGRVVLEIPFGPWRQRWVAQHRDAIPDQQFVDEQVEGPFASWVHTHRFAPLGVDRCRYTDHIVYQLPLGATGELGAGFVQRKLERLFRYRHATVAADLAQHQRSRVMGSRIIAITGATGLLGRSLIPFLTSGGHTVRRLVRSHPAPEDILWDPDRGTIDAARLEGVDAVIHLAGEPIAGGRWTDERKQRILDSRIRSTTLLTETLARLTQRPRVLVSASAIGIYGDRGDEVIEETAPLRTSGERMFVEQVGQAWEAAVEPAERAGIRVVRMRIGIVLSPAGGALVPMMRPIQFGMGGRLGSGRQFMSWIGINDIIGALYHAVQSEKLRGPVNGTAPAPVRNADFIATLARVLGRPALFPVPAPAIRLLMGQMADELVLTGSRVIPSRLVESGYAFRHPELAGALEFVLGR